MCDCTSCKETSKYADKPFGEWPKGERAPSTVFGRANIPADKAYKAHWAHCGAEAYRQRAKLDMRMHLPAGGTSRFDPHLGYAFPGGQLGGTRANADAKFIEKRGTAIKATANVEKYVKAFCKANNLKP
jgi:predicted oxidoreductase